MTGCHCSLFSPTTPSLMTVFSPEAAVVSAAASEPAAVVSAAAAVVSVFWLLPHAVKDNAKTAAAPSAKTLFFIIFLLLNFLCRCPFSSAFAVRTGQFLLLIRPGNSSAPFQAILI